MSNAILVAGAGSFGTALAIQLARVNPEVRLWGRNATQMDEIARSRVNQHYLPGIPLPEHIQCTSDLSEALSEVDDIVLAVPSHAVARFIDDIDSMDISRPLTLISAAKGLDQSLRLQSEIVAQAGQTYQFMVISGPSFAKEIGKGLFSALVLSGMDAVELERVQKRFHSDNFRVYTNHDLVGTQLGGALKNIYAIATGIADGLGLGANTRAAIITRALAEMTRLTSALGGHHETLMGLSGIGDLVLTCTDDQSRNRRLGLALGAGKTIEQAVKEIGQVVEGIEASKLVFELAQQQRVNMPITIGVNKILSNQASPKEIVEALVSRAPGSE